MRDRLSQQPASESSQLRVFLREGFSHGERLDATFLGCVPPRPLRMALPPRSRRGQGPAGEHSPPSDPGQKWVDVRVETAGLF